MAKTFIIMAYSLVFYRGMDTENVKKISELRFVRYHQQPHLIQLPI